MLGARQVSQNNHKIVSADAGSGIAFAQLLSDAPGRGAQQGIATGVPQAVIDALEVVQVQIQHGHRAVLLVRQAQQPGPYAP